MLLLDVTCWHVSAMMFRSVVLCSRKAVKGFVEKRLHIDKSYLGL